MTVPFNPFAGPAIARSTASTEGQREIWTAVQMGTNASLSYNEAVALQLRGALNLAALRSAVGTLVARHESLRATFSRDGLTMLIAEPEAPVIEMHDWTGASTDERAVARAALFATLVRTPFDLVTGPLVRFDLVTVQPDEHMLCISAHHIICDGWSFGVIAADIGACYEAAVASRPVSLPDAERYTDYAASLSTGDAAAARADDEAYWVQRFASVPEPLELPGDRPRPTLKSYPSAREDVHFPAALVRDLKTLGVKTGSSLFATLLAGFASLLQRLTGQDDLVVGIASAGQSASQRPQLVGHCVNTLPIRLQPTADLPFDQFVLTVRSASFDAFDHQGVGFGRVVERLAMPRDPSRIPLVSVVFNLDRALTAEALAFGGLEVSLVSVPRVAENFDLFVNAIEVAEGMVLECQYNTDMYDGRTVRRWLASFETLLRAAAATPSALIGHLALLTAEDESTLARCNDTALAVPPGQLVHELVELQVDATPDRIAVEADGILLTYAALEARANQLARALRAAGVGRGALVGLSVERTPAMLVALLGILKSGAGYVPLDPSYPAERLRFMAEDASLAALVTEDAVRRDLALTAPVIISLDGDFEALSAYPSTAMPRDTQSASPEDPAYVIFTSGSTGRPKGVLVPHRSVVNLLMGVRATPGMSSEDVVLAITTLSFDIAVSELWLPLTVGARIVLTTRDTASDGALLRDVIESRGITFIDATPATYRLLLAAGWMGSSRLRLICTGEALPRELAPELLSRARELWNGYGPTETTVWSTFARVEAPVRRVLIGRPVANTQVAIRDTQGEQVPIGVPGELFIGGAGVATGYLGRPDLTAERFVTDAETPSLRWYRTGDLVRLLPSGELECLGRTDDQVKIRGYRIEPGEVAAVVSRWPGVRQAVVVARELRPNDLRLVAYVVADDGVSFDEAFRAEMKRSLPDYMVPATVVRLERFPLTPSGKVDKKNLPAVDVAAAAPTTTFVAPRTPSEELLAGLWSEALGVARVSVEDDFFALGGHSLLASQILSRLRRDHGIEITFRRIFETPTVAGLAAQLDADRAAGTVATPKESIPHRADGVWSPLSALQERLWLLEELQPSRRPAHSHPASWQLTGPLDADALSAALHAFVMRHPMLRTSFHWRDGERRQQVHADVGFTMQRLDFSAMSEAEQRVALDAFFIDAQAVPFDLEVPPLFRAALIRLGDNAHRLYTLQHGMVWDGWSFDLFLHDVSEFYAAAADGRAPALRELSVDYGDFAAWQQGWLTSPAADKQRAWWEEQLAGVRDGIVLPVDHPRPLSSTHVGDQLSLIFTAEEVDQLYKLARAHDGTLFMVLFAAFSVLLQRYSGQRDLLVASPMRARTQPELEGVIGPFVNTVVLRTPISRQSTFADLIRGVRERALDTYNHQELPFELLGARMPTISAVFSMQDARERPKMMGNLAIRQVHVPLRFASNDLTLWMVQFPHQLNAVLNFSSDVIDRASAQAFLEQLRTLLQRVLQAPDVPLESIDLLGADEAMAERALPPAVPPAASMLESIAQAAAASPTNTAIRGNGRSVTYAALWEQSAHVAAALQARGVHAGDTVTVELSAAADRAVAIVGALRAGARVSVIPTDEAVEYQGLMRAAAAPSVRVAVTTLGDAIPTLTLAQADEAGGSVSYLASPGAGVALTWPDGSGGLHRADVPLARVDSQVAALVAHLAPAPAGAVVMHAVQQLSVAYVPTLLAGLAAGQTVALLDDATINDPLDLADEAKALAATTLIGTAEAWRCTLDAEWRSGVFPIGVMVGGGLSPEELRTLAERGTRGVATTGPAADASMTAVHPVTPDGENWFAGAPVGGAELRVLDGELKALPAGMPGMLWWARAGDDAWRRANGRARRTPGGRIQLLPDGGADVWVAGSPVETAVIEALLRDVPGVTDAALVAHRDKRGVPSLIAYVVPASGTPPDATSVRGHLRGRVPRDCVPARIVLCAGIARDDEGVPQRSRLPSPFIADAARVASAAPQTDSERAMADVWQEVLGIARVGRDDNFFGLGGTSLLCFRVIETMRLRTGVRLSPRALLTGTLSQAAAALTTPQ